MTDDRRRLPMVTARAVKRLTLRELACLISERIGRPISHVTVHNIEQNCRVDTAADVKAAICDVLGLQGFPEEGEHDAGNR